ncbi:hypothetical protein [Bacillus sp. AK128]
MEGILQQILNELTLVKTSQLEMRQDIQGLTEGQLEFKKEQAGMRQDIQGLTEGQLEFKKEQAGMRQDIQGLTEGQLELKGEQAGFRQDIQGLTEGQLGLKEEQAEMRKEIGFYYGSLMKKIDDTKVELSSEIKHVSMIQKQHQNVLEILNDRQ